MSPSLFLSLSPSFSLSFSFSLSYSLSTSLSLSLSLSLSSTLSTSHSLSNTLYHSLSPLLYHSLTHSLSHSLSYCQELTHVRRMFSLQQMLLVLFSIGTCRVENVYTPLKILEIKSLLSISTRVQIMLLFRIFHFFQIFVLSFIVSTKIFIC